MHVLFLPVFPSPPVSTPSPNEAGLYGYGGRFRHRVHWGTDEGIGVKEGLENVLFLIFKFLYGSDSIVIFLV